MLSDQQQKTFNRLLDQLEQVAAEMATIQFSSTRNVNEALRRLQGRRHDIRARLVELTFTQPEPALARLLAPLPDQPSPRARKTRR